jgi:hypothetical protein
VRVACQAALEGRFSGENGLARTGKETMVKQYDDN